MKYFLTEAKSDLAESIFKSVKETNAPTARAVEPSDLAALVGKNDVCVVVKSTGEEFCLRSPERKRMIEQRLQDIMTGTKIPPHLEGYQLIKDAVRLCCDTPRYVQDMKNGLYLKVGALNHMKSKNVERNIRTAVKKFCSQKDFTKFNEAIRIPNLYQENADLTNNELISVIADRLLFEVTVI